MKGSFTSESENHLAKELAAHEQHRPGTAKRPDSPGTKTLNKGEGGNKSGKTKTRIRSASPGQANQPASSGPITKVSK